MGRRWKQLRKETCFECTKDCKQRCMQSYLIEAITAGTELRFRSMPDNDIWQVYRTDPISFNYLGLLCFHMNLRTRPDLVDVCRIVIVSKDHFFDFADPNLHNSVIKLFNRQYNKSIKRWQARIAKIEKEKHDKKFLARLGSMFSKLIDWNRRQK